jgi:uncharacterized protein (DUF1919 family)
VDIKAFLKKINIDAFETAFKWRFIDKYFSGFERSKLKNKDFSIIGNNCVAGGMYHKFGLKYTTPTIWTFFFPEEYIRFLENLDWYLKQPLEFTKETKHPMAHRLSETIHRNYPIGVLGGDVEMHFMHYKTEEEALEKWTRRIKRVNFNNLFIIFSDAEEEFKEELLERYEKLTYEHKIFFSSKPRSNCKSTVFVEDYAEATHVYDSTRNRKYEKYIDLVKWLNCEKDFLKTKMKS